MQTILVGGNEFTPSKVVCVGQNFPAHRAEMGVSAPLGEPVLFLKPNSAILFGAAAVELPLGLGMVHHEIELVGVVGRRGRFSNAAEAATAITALGVGLDLTLRERQASAKSKGEPWDLAKGFDHSAVFGPFSPLATTAEVGAARDLILHVNAEIRQRGNTRDMLHSLSEILAFASRFYTFEAGDVVMGGTPSGVGPLADGDRVRAEAEGLAPLEVVIRRR